MKHINIASCLALMLLLSMPTFAQKKKGKQESEAPKAEAPAPPKKAPKKGTVKEYDEVITKEAKTDAGLFTVHRMADKYYFELPDSILEREILVVSRISGTVEDLNFGGAGMRSRPQQVIRWQKKDDKILLRSVSYNNVADDDLPIAQSVRNNNFEPIVMVFDVEAYGKDSTSSVIEVSKLFTSDVEMIGALDSDQRRRFQVRRLDNSRSMVVRMSSYPLNVEVRHVLTYDAAMPPANELTNTLSLEMNQSFIMLPEKPMVPRLFDKRVGYFAISQYDYGRDEQKAATRTYITRWRLEPKDPEAFKRGELVEPIKPIVYYIDPATPVKWRKYLKQGVEDWNKAFEAAGFKNAIMAKDAPTPEEDPEFSPEDVRYSVIRYVTNPIQNAMGPHVHDPRTGEILESDIIWYHNVMNLLRNWYFIQTAAINPKARAVKFDDEVMGECIRFVSAHEVGHTLGLPHNMGASASYPVDSLRSVSFTQKMGTAPSIMDYARFNYVAQPGDEGVALMPQIGIYDLHAIRWGYRPILDAKTSDDERGTLHNWIREHEGDMMYRFGRQTIVPIDPTAQTEDLGDDAMKASDYGIQNLKRILPNLIAWTKEDGKDYADLKELYGQVLGQWMRYMGHVTANVGGIYEVNKTYDQEGGIYTHVEKEKQERAVKFLIEQALETPTWMMDANILSRIEGAGMVNRVRGAQEDVLRNLLDFSRLARMIENETVNGKEAYGVMAMMDALRQNIWKEAGAGRSADTYRRNLQRVYVEALEDLLKEEQRPMNGPWADFFGHTPIDVSQSDIRPVARMELKKVQTLLKGAILRTTDALTKAHYEDLLARISETLDPK